MPDLTLISSVLGSVKTATDIAKALREADLSLAKAELKLKLADLMNALADARVSISSVQEDVLAKERRIKELEESLSTRERMKYEAPFYWLEEEGKREGPFCQHCYDANGKPIRLQDEEDGVWGCRVCSNHYARPGTHSRASSSRKEYDPYE